MEVVSVTTCYDVSILSDGRTNEVTLGLMDAPFVVLGLCRFDSGWLNEAIWSHYSERAVSAHTYVG